MVVGELDTAKMGLNANDSLPNYFIYFMFIGLMCTIVLNLFVGKKKITFKPLIFNNSIGIHIFFFLEALSKKYKFSLVCNYFSGFTWFIMMYIRVITI